MTGRKQHEEELSFVCVCACKCVCHWHIHALQTHTEQYLISLASWWLSCTMLSAEQTHVDSNYFRHLSTDSLLQPAVGNGSSGLRAIGAWAVLPPFSHASDRAREMTALAWWRIGQSTRMIWTQISPKLADGLRWTFVQTFMTPTGKTYKLWWCHLSLLWQASRTLTHWYIVAGRCGFEWYVSKTTGETEVCVCVCVPLRIKLSQVFWSFIFFILRHLHSFVY